MYYVVGVYKDSKGDLLFIPTAKTDAGFGININKPIVLRFPYHDLKVGLTVKESFEICAKEPIHDAKDIGKGVSAIEAATGEKSYKNFSKDRLALRIFKDTAKGYSIIPLIRQVDGSYRPNPEKFPEISLSLYNSDSQLGRTILECFQAIANRRN